MGTTHHDGVSVYGSGYWVGTKGGETLVIDRSGYVWSGKVTGSSLTSGAVTSTALGAQVVGSAHIANLAVQFRNMAPTLKFDGGTFGVSGWFYQEGNARTGLSTRLSSVTYAVATMTLTSASLLNMPLSGWASQVFCAASGHRIEFLMLATCSTPYEIATSCGTSNKIAWFAVGN